MHESHSVPHSPTSEHHASADTPESSTPDLEILRELGLKQLAREVARDRVDGEGTLEAWVLTEIVIPRAESEIATGVRNSPEEQVRQQVEIFEANVEYFSAKLRGDESDPEELPSPDAPEVNWFARMRSGIIGLTQRLQSLMDRRGRERGSERAETTHRTLGVTALTSERLASTEPSPFGNLVRSWDDVFLKLPTEYPPAIERDIKAAIANRFVQEGTMYYSGKGEYAINALNPPTMDEVMDAVYSVINGNQPAIAEQTKSQSFVDAQNGAATWQEKDRKAEAEKKAAAAATRRPTTKAIPKPTPPKSRSHRRKR